MGMDHRESIAATLIEHGWSPRTPVAVVADASLADQRVWTGSIGSMGSIGSKGSRGSNGSIGSGAATIIIGEVVSLAADAAAGLARTYVTGT
jgi:uroporphyrin-III C-methyltransferase/precorrin-2 dehydrogenase/sirohydrochlorin ferrochelatase